MTRRTIAWVDKVAADLSKNLAVSKFQGLVIAWGFVIVEGFLLTFLGLLGFHYLTT